MTVTQHAARSWTTGFRSLEEEQPFPVVLETEGRWPTELEGTLYRIGPSRHEVYGDRYRHWFDGDGMVHAFTVAAGGQVTHRSRFVDTDKKRAEDAAGHRLGPGFGTRPAGNAVQRLLRSRPSSAANTNVVAHAGRLLALWEQGRPWRIDPATLDTLGEDDLDGALDAHDTYSAHPRPHPITGDLWNFGVRYGPTTTLTLVRTTAAGHTEVVTRRGLPWPAMVHDFVVTPTRVVVLVPPLTLPRIPVGLMVGQRTYADSLRWRPSLGTRALVYDIADDRWQAHSLDPLMFFHLVDAVDDGDDVVLDVCASHDRSLFDAVGGFLDGRADAAQLALERIVLAPGAAPRRFCSSPTGFEFPRVVPRPDGASYRHVFGTGRHPNGDFIGTPVRVDVDTGTAIATPVGPDEYAGECVPVPKAGARRDDQAWVLTLVLDAATERTQLWVLDGEDPGGPPVATATVPYVIPFGFHGSWVPATASP